MDKNKALEILVQSVEVATKKGAFTLNECVLIAQAITVLQTPEMKEPDPQSQPKEPTK